MTFKWKICWAITFFTVSLLWLQFFYSLFGYLWWRYAFVTTDMLVTRWFLTGAFSFVLMSMLIISLLMPKEYQSWLISLLSSIGISYFIRTKNYIWVSLSDLAGFSLFVIPIIMGLSCAVVLWLKKQQKPVNPLFYLGLMLAMFVIATLFLIPYKYRLCYGVVERNATCGNPCNDCPKFIPNFISDY